MTILPLRGRWSAFLKGGGTAIYKNRVVFEESEKGFMAHSTYCLKTFPLKLKKLKNLALRKPKHETHEMVLKYGFLLKGSIPLPIFWRTDE